MTLWRGSEVTARPLGFVELNAVPSLWKQYKRNHMRFQNGEKNAGMNKVTQSFNLKSVVKNIRSFLYSFSDKKEKKNIRRRILLNN